MKKLSIAIFIFLFLTSGSSIADEVSGWLKKEIDIILKAYSNNKLSGEQKFAIIEETIDTNFAGTGIAKFIAGKAWKSAEDQTKKQYILSFKKHLALNIASMMQGYSDQTYELSNSKIDKNKVILIDMEIFSETGSVVITWRLKKSKDRYFIIDLIVADISLVVTKRSEFNSMLKNVDNDLYKFNKILMDQNKISFEKIIN